MKGINYMLIICIELLLLIFIILNLKIASVEFFIQRIRICLLLFAFFSLFLFFSFIYTEPFYCIFVFFLLIFIIYLCKYFNNHLKKIDVSEIEPIMLTKKEYHIYKYSWYSIIESSEHRYTIYSLFISPENSRNLTLYSLNGRIIYYNYEFSLLHFFNDLVFYIAVLIFPLALYFNTFLLSPLLIVFCISFILLRLINIITAQRKNMKKYHIAFILCIKLFIICFLLICLILYFI